MPVLHELPLVARPGAYAELEYASVAEDVVAAANDTRMRELDTKIVLAQIRMGVEMDYVQVRVALRHGADAAKRDEMLAAKQERDLPGAKDLRGALFDHAEGSVWRTKRKLKIARVEYGSIFGEVAVLKH